MKVKVKSLSCVQLFMTPWVQPTRLLHPWDFLARVLEWGAIAFSSHNSSLGKFKKIEIIPSIFSDHHAVRLDVSYRRKTIKNTNIWRLNNTLLNNQQITEEIKREVKIYIETNENENTTTPNLWDSVKVVLR